MPQERLPMRNIREVLRLKADGFSKRRIAASLGIGATAAMECVQRAQRAGLRYQLPIVLDHVASRRMDHLALESVARSQSRGGGAIDFKLRLRRGTD